MRKKTHLDRMISHYTRIAKGDNREQMHYALGVLDVLIPLRAIHEEMTTDMREQWRLRIGTGGEQGPLMISRRTTKVWADRINSINVGHPE